MAGIDGSIAPATPLPPRQRIGLGGKAAPSAVPAQTLGAEEASRGAATPAPTIPCSFREHIGATFTSAWLVTLTTLAKART